jgi:hypothetical protein
VFSPRSVPPFRLAVTIAAALALVGAGCGGGASHSHDAGDTFYDCTKETRALPYSEGMQIPSQDQTVALALVKSEPGPPAKGDNTWTVSVADGATGTGLGGLTISVTPYMPDHGHGSPRQVVVTPAADAGTYVLTPLYLFMGGYWEVTFDLGVSQVGTRRTAMLPVCIPG